MPGSGSRYASSGDARLGARLAPDVEEHGLVALVAHGPCVLEVFDLGYDDAGRPYRLSRPWFHAQCPSGRASTGTAFVSVVAESASSDSVRLLPEREVRAP